MTKHQAPEVTSELLPCPFCGAPDGRLVQAFTRATETFAYWSVECLDCSCEIASDASQAEAITAWNTRATQPQSLTIDGVLTALAPFARTFVPKAWRDDHTLMTMLKAGDYRRAALALDRLQSLSQPVGDQTTSVAIYELDCVIAAVVAGKQISGEEGRRATSALNALRAALAAPKHGEVGK